MAADKATKEIEDLLRQCNLSSEDCNSESSSSSRSGYVHNTKPQPHCNVFNTSSKGKYGKYDCTKPILGRKLQTDESEVISISPIEKYAPAKDEDVDVVSSSGSSGSSDDEDHVPKNLENPNISDEEEESDRESSTTSHEDDEESDSEISDEYQQVKVTHQPPAPLESLGTVTPLFDKNAHVHEESRDDVKVSDAKIRVEFVSDDTDKLHRRGRPTHPHHSHARPHNLVERNENAHSRGKYDDYPNRGDHCESPSLETLYRASDSEEEETETQNPATSSSSKTNNVMGKVLRKVRSQFSFTNLKRMRKEAQSSFSKTLHDLNDPKAYPRKPDRKMLQGEKVRARSKNFTSVMAETSISDDVEPFHWVPERHTDPNFKNFVECQVFQRLDSRQNAGVTLPDWLSSAPAVENLLYTKSGASQSAALLLTDYENAQKNQPDLWEKARNNNVSKACPRLSMYISSKMTFSSEILTLKYCNILKSSLLAVGSHSGLLKLVQFKDLLKSPNHRNGPCPEMNITDVVRNELLNGHTIGVTKLEWLYSNVGMAKLMSVDDQGVIVVWDISEKPGHQQVAFFQEGSFSKILDFAWSPDSKRVCIIYSDAEHVPLNSSMYGLVVGRLEDGAREWTKPCPNILGPPQAVAWLDDTKFILVQGNALSVFCYTGKVLETRHFDEDELGDHASLGKLMALLIKPCTAGDNTGPFGLGLIWATKIAMLRTVSDRSSLIFDPQLTVSSCDWSRTGQYIAVAGSELGNRELCSQINIYSSFGRLLTILKIAEPSIASISWDTEGMNLAIGSQTLVYVASVRNAYKFASTGVIHAYAFTAGCENFVAVWDKININIQKVEGKVVDLKNHGQRFALLAVNSQGIYSVAILTKTGLCIDALVILTMEPFAVCLTDMCLICLSANSILFWRYNSSLSQPDFEKTTSIPKIDEMSKSNSVKQIHIDDIPSFAPMLKNDTENRATLDPGVCMDAKYDRLIVARNSGKLQIYCLPQGGLLQTIEVARFRPCQILLNPTSTKIALLDISGSLRLGHVENNGTEVKVDVDIISSEVLNMVWSNDMPDFLCVMKRTEMCIIRYANFERIKNFHALCGYLAGFDNMKITLLNLDAIFQNPNQPNASHVLEVNMQILDTLPGILKNGDTNPTPVAALLEKVSHIDHPRLWNALGEEQLKLGNYEDAHFAFVRSQNYPALQFLKKVTSFPEYLQQAEIFTFLEDFDSASRAFADAKRTDLGLKMWQDLDHPSEKSRFMAKLEGFGEPGMPPLPAPEFSLKEADKYFKHGDFINARRMYKSLKQYDRVLECYMAMDDYGLEWLIQNVSKGHPIMEKIAEKYAFMGMTEKAVAIYLKSGSPKKAVDVALTNMDWSSALEIAQEHNIPMVAQSILDLTKQLLSTGNIMEAAQFLKKCGKTFAAGKLLATAALRKLQSPPATTNLLNVKKLFVMAATLLQKRTETTLKSRTRGRTKSRHFPREDEIDVKFDESIPHAYHPTMEEFRWMRHTPWRGAMGVQFLILVSNRINQKRFEKATVLATHLRNYTDILGAERVNCLVALASAHGDNTFHCLGALSQLENLSEDYAEIAVELLASNEKKENGKHGRGKQNESSGSRRMCCGAFYQVEGEPCPKCDLRLPLCIISGNVLTKKAWTCENCGAFASESKLRRFKYCPLCHHQKADDFVMHTY